MESIKDRVAIVGMGCTEFGEKWDKSSGDLVVDACYEAFEDAGVDPQRDIQAAWVASCFSQFTSGYTGQILSIPLKLEYKPITRVENFCASGTDALRNAAYAVAAGMYDVVLVAGVEKLKDSGFAGLPYVSAIPDPSVTEMMHHSVAPVHFALAATRYFYHYNLSPEEGKRILGKIAVKNHHNGTLSPKAHFRREVTLEQVINAPMIAWPLGLFDCCGNSDGAAAAIITRAELAKNFRHDYVLIKGLGMSVGAKQGELQDDYDFVHFEETVTAGQAAYQEAGITNPRDKLDLAIVHDCFTITELIIYEDLGFSPRGKGKEDVDSGFFSLDGGLPVNTDGGLKCFGHPIAASGLRMVYEVYKQLQGKAGARQLKDPKIGLTHNLGGVPGNFSTCCVAILGRPDYPETVQD
ncbi:MAG: acetyl-CoA acetyltransferase [Chloroflexi bacterium CG08_land_8_20_14_0_20_45_12]|nr:MAG: acetyl-CoA acetyltransferase [Chloroflexi bacterium CG08_land_8_20_14_0_20_45_12]